jgi:PAS domain-containing protein
VTFANDRAETIFGRDEEEILTHSHDDERWNLVDWNGEPIAAEELPFARVRRSGDPVFDERLGTDRPDGRRVWLSVSCAPCSTTARSTASSVRSRTSPTAVASRTSSASFSAG